MAARTLILSLVAGLLAWPVVGQDSGQENAQEDVSGSLDSGPVVPAASPEQVWLSVVDRDLRVLVGGARVRPVGGAWTAVGDDGLVQLTLASGRNVTVVAEGYFRTRLELPPGVGSSADEPFLIALAPAFVVQGRYVAADGLTPAANGRWAARGAGKGALMSVSGTVAADGAFLVHLWPDDYELELSASNTGTTRLVLLAGEGREVRDLGIVVAAPSAGVSGTVVDSERLPVAEATVSRLSETDQAMAWAKGDAGVVKTDAEGRFELFGLETGVSNLRVEAEGFAPLDFAVETPALDLVEIGAVELARGRRVFVQSDVGEGQVVLDHPQDRKTAPLERGAATVAEVPEGAFLVQVLEDGLPVCERAVTETGDVSARCDRSTVAVAGRVTLGDRRPGSGKLLWRREARASLPEGVGGHPESPQEREALLDGAGRYRVEAVLPGAWEVVWTSLDAGKQPARKVAVPDGPGGSGSVVTLDFDYGGVSVVGLARKADGSPATEEVTVRLAGASSGFCFVEMEAELLQVARIESGAARQLLVPPLADRLRVACRADGHWTFAPWRDLGEALADGVDLEPRESTSTITLVGEASSETPVEIVGPGGWDLGSLRIWFDGGKTFRAGESIPNLPAGSYTLRWGAQSQVVNTERGRAVEVQTVD